MFQMWYSKLAFRKMRNGAVRIRHSIREIATQPVILCILLGGKPKLPLTLDSMMWRARPPFRSQDRMILTLGCTLIGVHILVKLGMMQTFRSDFHKDKKSWSLGWLVLNSLTSHSCSFLSDFIAWRGMIRRQSDKFRVDVLRKYVLQITSSLYSARILSQFVNC